MSFFGGGTLLVVGFQIFKSTVALKELESELDYRK